MVAGTALENDIDELTDGMLTEAFPNASDQETEEDDTALGEVSN